MVSNSPAVEEPVDELAAKLARLGSLRRPAEQYDVEPEGKGAIPPPSDSVTHEEEVFENEVSPETELVPAEDGPFPDDLDDDLDIHRSDASENGRVRVELEDDQADDPGEDEILVSPKLPGTPSQSELTTPVGLVPKRARKPGQSTAKTGKSTGKTDKSVKRASAGEKASKTDLSVKKNVLDFEALKSKLTSQSSAEFDKKVWKKSRIQKGYLIKRLTGYDIKETEYGVQYLGVLGRKPDRTSADVSVFPLAGFFTWVGLADSGLFVKERGSHARAKLG
jgi:hypothetical protein